MGVITKRIARGLYRVAVSLDPSLVEDTTATPIMFEGEFLHPRFASLKNLVEARNVMEAFECQAEIVRHERSQPIRMGG